MTTPTPTTEPPHLSVGIAIDVGRSRKDKPNQDSLGTYEKYVADPALLRAKGLLFVVADGMGGAAGGKEASETAVQSIIQGYYDNPEPDPQVCLEHAIQAANTEIGQIGRADPSLSGLGTTLVVALFLGQRLLVANVGDSRVYLYRRGRLRQLSLDHTVVQEHLRAGLLTPEEAMVHPRRHVLSRNLGSRPEAQPEYVPEFLQLGDIVLLCSDGLWGPVSDYEIGQLLKQDTQPAAEALKDRANAQGGPDNISAIVVRVDAWGAPIEPVEPTPAPITQPFGDETQKLRAAPTTVVLSQPAEDAPPLAPAPPSAPAPTPEDDATTRRIMVTPATHMAATRTQPIAPQPPQPPLPALAAETPATSDSIRDKIGDAPAALPPPRKHAKWMIPAIVGGIIIVFVVGFMIVRPVSAPTTAEAPATAIGTFAVAPTQARPGASPSALATTGSTSSNASATVESVAALNPTVTILAPPTGTPEPTAFPASTASALAEVTVQPDSTAPAATVRAVSGGGALTGGQTPTTRREMVVATDGNVLAFDADGQIASWNADGEPTTPPILAAGQNLAPGNVLGTLAGPYGDGSIVRLRVTADGVVSDTLEVDQPSSSPLPAFLAAFSPDGTKLVYATTEGAIRFWSTTDGTSRLLTTHSQNTITSLAWSRDGSVFATATDDGTTELWDANGQQQTPIEQGAPIVALAFDPTGTVLASLTDEQNVRLVTLATGGLSELIAPRGSWSALAFDASGTRLMAGAQDGTMVMWRDPLTPNASAETIGDQTSQAISALAFTPDNAQVAALGADGTVRFLPVSSN